MGYYPFIGPNREVFFVHLAEPAGAWYAMKPVIMDGPSSAPLYNQEYHLYTRSEHEYEDRTIVQYVSTAAKPGHFNLRFIIQEEYYGSIYLIFHAHRQKYWEKSKYQPNKIILHPAIVTVIAKYMGEHLLSTGSVSGPRCQIMGMEVVETMSCPENEIWMTFEPK